MKNIQHTKVFNSGKLAIPGNPLDAFGSAEGRLLPCALLRVTTTPCFFANLTLLENKAKKVPPSFNRARGVAVAFKKPPPYIDVTNGASLTPDKQPKIEVWARLRTAAFLAVGAKPIGRRRRF